MAVSAWESLGGYATREGAYTRGGVAVTPEHWKRVAELFEAAIEHEPEARADFVARATAGDAPLAEEVLRLIASDENAGTFLNNPAGLNSDESSSKTARDPFIGRILSHYRRA